MAQIELLLPKMGESVAEATVTSWLKDEGDFVELEEGILEIATDKVDSEVPSDYEGTLVKKLFKEGEVVKIGTPFAIIEVEGEVKKEELKEEVAPSAYDEPIYTPEPPKEDSTISIPVLSTTSQKESNKFYSPLVKSIAKKEGVSFDELNRISVLIESHQKALEKNTKVIIKEVSKSVLKVIMMAKLEQILNLE